MANRTKKLLFAMAMVILTIVTAHLVSEHLRKLDIEIARQNSEIQEFNQLGTHQQLISATAVTLDEVRVIGGKWKQYYILEIFKQPEFKPFKVGQKIGRKRKIRPKETVRNLALALYFGDEPHLGRQMFIDDIETWRYSGYPLRQIKTIIGDSKNKR